MNQKRLHHILTAVVLAFCILQAVASCDRKTHTDPPATPRLEQLRRDATSAASMDDFGRSDSIGRILYREAEAAGNDIYMAYGLMCQSFYANNISVSSAGLFMVTVHTPAAILSKKICFVK